MAYRKTSVFFVPAASLLITALFLASCATAKTSTAGLPAETPTAPQPATASRPPTAGLVASPENAKMAMAAGLPGPGPQSPAQPHYPPNHNTEEYAKITDNPFLEVRGNPLSTFSIDVDTASYANVRRYLLENRSLPIPDAVRIEELLNYFPYSYAPPSGKDPVAYSFSLAQAPWNKDHELLRVAVKAAEIDTKDLPPSNLVFLIDCSGSMADDNKLPLLKEGLHVLVRNLRQRDKVSIVVYAGRAGLLLPPTPGDKYEIIIQAIDGLVAGGSTAGGEGIQLAFKTAKENYIRGGNNRVILATDGDFNVGISSTSELERYIENQRKENIYLTVLGLGMGNYKDNRMETLADKGNGSYAYIDNLLEARKVLGKEIWGNLFTVAKDVKLQVEFNPARVAAWRLIGYENRVMRAEDFKDDAKDAGAVGSGHAVTALYELVPAGRPAGEAGEVEPLRYQRPRALAPAAASEEIFTLQVRYKEPEGAQSRELVFAAPTQVRAEPSGELTFAAGVAAFGMILRGSPNKGAASFDLVLALAEQGRGEDRSGYRREFAELVRAAARLKGAVTER